MHGLSSLIAINAWAAEQQLKQKLSTVATKCKGKRKGGKRY
jgi:hypothetical protein